MSSKLMVGGHQIQELPAFKMALQQEQEGIRRAYDQKVAELEKERQMMEQEKVQNYKYKQLLLKQRDIMIQLTARLNERDQSIMHLQEELDAYDTHQRMMEDALDSKTAALIQLQKQVMDSENGDLNGTHRQTIELQSALAKKDEEILHMQQRLQDLEGEKRKYQERIR